MIANSINNHGGIPPLNGLALAGGQSMRMGRDKGLLNWHGKPQRYYLADLLAQCCAQVYISCRADQVDAIVAAGYKALPDTAAAPAQYGAILSAMTARPDSAWLVLACDLPLVDSDTLAYLAGQRDPAKLATAFAGADDGLPEPLAAIWEPAARSMLLGKLAEGITCPRKALIRSESDVKLIEAPHSAALTNVNTPEAAGLARELL